MLHLKVYEVQQPDTGMWKEDRAAKSNKPPVLQVFQYQESIKKADLPYNA